MESISLKICNYINEWSNWISASVVFDEYWNIKFIINFDWCLLASSFYDIFSYRKELNEKTKDRIDLYVWSIDLEDWKLVYNIWIVWTDDEWYEIEDTFKVENICRKFWYTIFLK